MNPLRCWPRLEPVWRRAGVEYYPYQIQTAVQVVEELNGRAILADEVGLGKTIEAGLVARELMARGLARRILILTPASLVLQWAREMKEKFELEFAINPAGADYVRHDRIIASLDLAKRAGHREWLPRVPFDLVVVDEAHRLKNRNTLNHQLIRELRERYLLLLSATPMQNDLVELFGLVSLVRPNLFGSFSAFQRRFLIDKRTPRNPRELKAILSQVMVRNKRRDTHLQFPARQVALIPLYLSPGEKELYEELTGVLRREYWHRRYTKANILPLLTLQREVCSSSHALRQTLERMEEDALGPGLRHLRYLAESVRENTKAGILEGLMPKINDKTIIFTEFRATQEFLAQKLMREGFRVVKFHGGLSMDDKDRAQRQFRDDAQILISTECGGQGLNLQFCHNIINYDLPWNPMRVEQRIGRVHRLGQTDDVHIYNLCAQETVEEHILRLLDEKINLFREVIGELDIIIRHLERRRSIESTILDIALSARDHKDMERRFEGLGEQITSISRRIRNQEAYAWMS